MLKSVHFYTIPMKTWLCNKRRVFKEVYSTHLGKKGSVMVCLLQTCLLPKKSFITGFAVDLSI